MKKGGWGDFKRPNMLVYRADLKQKARQLRSHLTDSEIVLWSRLKGKQILGVQFYRQKPIGDYIIDFFAPKVKLVVEVDGSQHHEQKGLDQDKLRDAYLAGLGLKVLRFNSNVVLRETDSIVEVIYKTITAIMELKIPPAPLY